MNGASAAVASMQALRAYLDGKLFAAALARSGPHPTPLHFARVLEAMPAWSDPRLAACRWTTRPGTILACMPAIWRRSRNGRWRLIGQPMALPPH